MVLAISSGEDFDSGSGETSEASFEVSAGRDWEAGSFFDSSVSETEGFVAVVPGEVS